MELGRVRRPDRDHLGDRRARPQRQPAGRDRGPDREAAAAERGADPRSRRASRSTASCANRSSKRIEALEKGGIEFGHAEALAFASLLTEGVHIRLTGQDTERGTFSHRHLVLHDEKTGLEYCPMQNLDDANAPFELYNSPLSEIACLGFEYGYSAATPNALVLWEAQFGDFANAGQVIIDSFIVSGEAKWGQTSRLTLLLPHGYEGSGPGALERPDRALPGAGGRGQHPHRQPDHRRPVLPPAAPPGADPQAAAAGRLHPQGPAAPRPGRRHARRS